MWKYDNEISLSIYLPYNNIVTLAYENKILHVHFYVLLHVYFYIIWKNNGFHIEL